MNTENSVENSVPADSRYRGLKPWRPGQSGNPGGRPKGMTRRAIRKVLRERGPDGERTVYGFARDLVKHARAGDAVLAQMVIDEADGPLPKPAESANANQQQIFVLPSWSCALEASIPKPDQEPK